MGCGGGKAIKTIPSSEVIFQWGIEGKVKIKSLKFKAIYDADERKIQVENPCSRLTESLLEWRGREFTISDRLVKDILTLETYSFPELKLKFRINTDDSFKEITNTTEILNSLNTLYSSQITVTEKSSMLEYLESELREFWKSCRQSWIYNATDVKVVEIKHLGRDCIKLFKDIDNDASSLGSFLVTKFKPTNVKLASRIIKQIAILDKLTGKPHIVKHRRTEYVGMTVNNESVWDLEEDIKVYIFCWEDVNELNRYEIVKEEFEFIENGSKEIMRDFLEQINNYAEELGINIR